MASRKKKQAFSVVRCFEVSNPTLHPKGHTIYKVKQKLIRVDAPEENVQEVVVWRRYNDFKKLYKTMYKLHQGLHRREEFPPFVEAKVFGRFDHNVVQERMLCAQDLLNFIGQRHYLINTPVFESFFEGAEKVKFHPYDPIMAPEGGFISLDSADGGPPDGTVICPKILERSSEGSTPPMQGAEALTSEAGLVLPIPQEHGSLSRVSSDGDILGGVWKYRQAADEISLGDGDEDEDENTDFTDESALSTPRPDTDLSFFDPLKSEDDNDITVGQESNLWLLGGKGMVRATTEEVAEEKDLRRLSQEFADVGLVMGRKSSSGADDTLTPIGEVGDGSTTQPDVPDVEAILNLPDVPDGSLQSDESSLPSPVSGGITPSEPMSPQLGPEGRPKSGSIVESGKGDLTMSPVHPDMPGVPNAVHSPTGFHAGCPDIVHGLLPDPVVPSSRPASTSSTPGQVNSPARHNLVKIDIKDRADYIFLAASQISLAQQCEVNNNYHMAFSYYKSAVGILLTGVQKDDNQTRIELVRMKTARYLIKAEELYHKYLDSRERADQLRWDTGKPSPAKELDPKVAFLQGSLSELKQFKVLGVIDSVLLIMDTLAEKTYVIKTLRKSAVESGGRNIIPTHIPFMVRMYKFYETESAIYLLLQHATGGRLWNYISGYLSQSQQGDDMMDDIINKMHPKDDGSSNTLINVDCGPNIYQGTRSVFSHHVEQRSGTIPAEFGNGDSVLPSNSSPENTMSGQVRTELGDGKVVFSGNTESISFGVETKLSRHTEPQQDNDFLSLDGSQSETSFRKALHESGVSHKKSATSIDKADTAGIGHVNVFDDVLEGAKRPSLEYFSINSCDSDSETSAPNSRLDSMTTEHIESIPELSESSPSPHKQQTPHDTSDSNGEVFNPAEVICSANVAIAEADDVLANGNISVSVIEEELTVTIDAQPHGALLTSTPNHKIRTNAVERGEAEKSIYDVFKSRESDDASSCPSESQSPNTQHSPPTITSNLHKDPAISQISSAEGQCEQCNKNVLQPPIFRTVSQERSVEVGTERRSRTRTLSSVFGSLEGGGESVRVGTVRLPEGCVRQWAAEVVIALSNLHIMGLYCRDLRPDNLLLGERGHVLLTHCAEWACVQSEPHPDAVAHLYAAPEVGSVYGSSPACDWWSLGALIYELITGQTLASCHPSGVTSHTKIYIPDTLSAESQSLLTQLLKFSPGERLREDEIKMHPFFSGINWAQLHNV